MNSLERFVHTVNFAIPDRPFVKTPGGWSETSERWRREGWNGKPLDQIFGSDGFIYVEVYYGPIPRFEYKIVEEDETSRTYINHEGILMREFKEYSGNSSMPQFLKFPVQDEADFDLLCHERLGLKFIERIPRNWEDLKINHPVRRRPSFNIARRFGGFFGPLRNFMGLENLCLAFHDQPELIEKMMAQRADIIISIAGKMLEQIKVDMFAFWEDMAYKAGSLINPQMFRKFAFPHYVRVCDFLRSQGVEFIALDSDGDIRELIPIWLNAGINVLYPFEVAAGMDVVAMRKEYGKDLIMMDGIDKRAVAIGGKTMQKEVDRVMPLVEEGGYIPGLDHSAPPDISWPNICEFMEYLMGHIENGV